MQYIFVLVFVCAHVVCSFIGSFILYWESGFTLFTFGYFNLFKNITFKNIPFLKHLKWRTIINQNVTEGNRANKG